MRLTALAVFVSLAAFAEQPLAAYPGTVNTRIGNDLVIGGELYRMAYFTTDDGLVKVAAHFAKEWKEAGYPVTQSGDFVNDGVVSAFFTRQGLMRSIVLHRHDGRTLGFSVLKDLWVRPEQRADRIPKPEGALYATEVLARGDDGNSQHRSSVFSLPIDAARDQRDAAWVRAGWARTRETTVKRAEDQKPERVLEYARSAELAVVTLVSVDAKTTAIDETWVGQRDKQ